MWVIYNSLYIKTYYIIDAFHMSKISKKIKILNFYRAAIQNLGRRFRFLGR
jgi:hypothetical protein